MTTHAQPDPSREPGGRGPAGDPGIEALLAACARRQAAPPGLSARVFEASVGLLPVRRPNRGRVLRLEPIRPAALWGRLAMAASVALAFVVAVQTLQPRRMLSPDAELALWEYVEAPDLGLATIIDFQTEGFSAIESMLVTRDMTFSDLSGDLEIVAADLGL